MKKIIILLFIVGLSQNIFAQSTPLAEAINKENVFLVDVRSKEEFALGSAKGAVNIPINEIAKHLQEFHGKENIVLFCRSGRRATNVQKILQKQGVSALMGGSVENITALQKDNLTNKLSFNSKKPHNINIKSTDSMEQLAIALGKDVWLKKHTTNKPAQLIMIKGCVNFIIKNEQIQLDTFDTYDIPINEEHTVQGIDDENIFIITKGNW